jgi:hypothetical protein
MGKAKRGHKLMTKAIEKTIPKLYSQEKVKDPIVRVKFFSPYSNWTWYVTEGETDGEDWRFFGLVDGFEVEWGYFMLSELEEVEVKVMGYMLPAVERDCYCSPKPISQTTGGKKKGIKPEPKAEEAVFHPEGPNAFPKEIPMENGGPKQTLTVAMLDKMSGKPQQKTEPQQRPFFDKEDTDEQQT